MSVTFAEFQADNENTKAVRKILGAVLALAPEDAAPIASISGADGLTVSALPAEYWPVGLLTPDGITFDREVSTDEVEALGHASPVREDIESAARRLSFSALEVLRKGVRELAEGVDLSGVEVSATGEVTYDIPDLPLQRYYRAVVIGFDGSPESPHFDGIFYPRVSVTSFPSEQWQKSGARTAEIGMTAYADPELGFIQRNFHAGAGFQAIAGDLGWTTATP